MEEMVASLFILLALLLLTLKEVSFAQAEARFSRDDFSPDFIFGAGTSAYQVEGAAAEDGRSPSVWDTFTHAGGMPDKSTGDVASDGYHKYKEDVKLMADTGLESYKFSISWSRLLPNGRGAINPKGLAFYNNLIDELLKYGIKPHVTLYHLDLPQVLEDEYGGWLSRKIVNDFTAYSDVCFREFGDRVSQWTTMSEPNIAALASYDQGQFPPNRCSYPFGFFNCTAGDSSTEPYIAFHNMLLAHTSAVTLYRKKYQAIQNGWIGINLYTFWYYPFTNSTKDIKATQRTIDFMTGWVLDPLVFGDYPKVMKKIVGSRLPSFTKGQSKQIKGAFDFIGLNHYGSIYIKDISFPSQNGFPRDFFLDMSVSFKVSRNETSTDQFDPARVPSDPAGLAFNLEYLKEAYGNHPFFIEENGCALGMNETLQDVKRIDFLHDFIGGTLDALRKGINVKGYYVWSFLDVFEFLSGYKAPLGLYHVNFEDDKRRRQPKLSAVWYSEFLKNKSINMNVTMSHLHAQC